MKKIIVLSIHDLGDNRINKHIRKVLSEGYSVRYVNASEKEGNYSIADERLKVVHIPIPYIKKSGLKILWIYWRMIQEIKRNPADIVHIHDPQLLCLAKIAVKRGARVVYDRHESYESIPLLTSRLGTFFEKRYAKWIQGVVYVSSTQLDYIQNVFQSISVIIPNYQSKLTFSCYEKSSSLRKIHFIYIGSLEESLRNIQFMLSIMRRVLAERTECSFTLGGKCTNTKLLKEIERFELETDRFEYCGYVPYEKVVEKTVNSDIGLLFLKQCENTVGASVNKIYEYLLAGLAVVGMGNFMHSEEIEQMGAGMIFAYDVDEETIVRKIFEILDSPKQLEDFKDNAKKMGEKYAWEDVADEYLKLYKEIERRKA